MSKFWIFLTSVWQEAKKIKWPTKKRITKFYIGSFSYSGSCLCLFVSC